MEETNFIVPPFLKKNASPEKSTPIENTSDPFAGSMMNSILPDFRKRTANLHYISEVTGEYGTIHIRPGISEDDIMDQYAKLFPTECGFFLQEIKSIGQVLFSSTGMSKEQHMMSLTKIPQIIYLAMKFIDEEYWADKKRYYRFIRKYPKFMIGDHRHKQSKGIIIR